MTERFYGFNRQLPDFRDEFFMFTPKPKIVLPSSVDLRIKGPTPYNQGPLGSCTGNGTGRIVHYGLLKQSIHVFAPSRLFIYYNERVMEGTVNQDAGASIRDGIKSIASQGVCDEILWPYDVKKFATKPPVKCFADAKKHKALLYRPVKQELDIMKACLAEGFPIVIGFSVYPSFESEQVAKTGVVPMPNKTESLLGGHCVTIDGYIDSVQRFICCNSWGTGWGENGYFSMPYEYLTNPNLACDFWMIETIFNSNIHSKNKK